MAAAPNELLYLGSNQPGWYAGYNSSWIMPTRVEKVPAEKQDDSKKGVIEMRMPFCCDGCVEKVQKKLKIMEGVGSVEIITQSQKVIVRGTAKPTAVLKEAKRIVDRTEFWKERK
ncbi:hypothetical protein MPTK1_2g12490 [Marchantia polymorpha subsp. ruderalis]|uniref:HMA domain-containing protein n=2 Tax=Marchantia polymorpha TaxID=3197 RepID=A0A176VMC1_MARPO|nr:hypothetical protein AXG93_3256s1630 [Marchantia polymorpha subsp. ruderalis]PTQ43252.1 hypothetical protein MARPO_0026s0122 [Marchantia polymorpha]BBN02069.1 hypothetical protein Mp_2g12490 [Marchantia polymorpha subsp. ruderalis]|eukprot:PTQ43252.1 hypothetical protein MARPO_0026s0122 [Marchantia polymorpha]